MLCIQGKLPFTLRKQERWQRARPARHARARTSRGLGARRGGAYPGRHSSREDVRALAGIITLALVPGCRAPGVVRARSWSRTCRRVTALEIGCACSSTSTPKQADELETDDLRRRFRLEIASKTEARPACTPCELCEPTEIMGAGTCTWAPCKSPPRRLGHYVYLQCNRPARLRFCSFDAD